MKDINLLPEEIKSSSSYVPDKVRSGGVVKVIIILLFVILILGGSVLAPQAYVKYVLEAKLARINEDINSPKYAEVKKVRADLTDIDKTLETKKDVIGSIDNSNYPVNEVLVAINNVAPQGCVIESIAYGKKSLEIVGQAQDSVVIAELVSRINRLSFLTVVSDVNFDSANVFKLSLKVGGKEGDAQ